MQQHPHILPPPPPNTSRPLEKQSNLIRFQAELEFIQCLSNPLYLRELSVQGYLEKEEFVKYLDYLQYWRGAEYVRFIVYPTCLVYLTLLLQPTFRERLGDPMFISELMRVGVRHHETWRVEEAPKNQADEQGEPAGIKVDG